MHLYLNYGNLRFVQKKILITIDTISTIIACQEFRKDKVLNILIILFDILFRST